MKGVFSMASFRKLSSGWKVTISQRDNNGKLQQTSKSGFLTKSEARLYAAKIEAKKTGVISAKKDIELSKYFDYWYKTYKENKVTESTLRHYVLTSKIIKKYFGIKKIQKITREDYQSFLNWYGANHAKETIAKINGYVRACAKNAILDDIITKDFTQRTELKFNQQNSMKVEYLNVKEINLLINSAKYKLDPRYTSRYMILTAIYTGMRLGEIMALTWEDVDFKHKTISINKSYDYHSHKIKTTKTTSSNRTISVNSDLLGCLSQLKKNKMTDVFRNNQNTVPSSNAVNKKLKELFKQCNINKKGFHFHSLRHSHVAYLLFRGVDLYAISKRLGHSNMMITAKKYAYLIDEYKARNDNKIEHLMDNLGQQQDNKVIFYNGF
jgi:integrase